MASIDFYVDNGIGSDFNIDTSGSGLGFYGSGGFGASVSVGEYQDNTYVTDGNGATQGPQANNVKWRHANSGEISGSTVLNLLDIPNSQSTLKISFTHATAVKVQNCEMRIYDRSSINNAASGVTTKAAEIIHPSATQTGSLGSGDSSWVTPAGSSVVLSLAQSPGESGLLAGDGTTSTTTDTRHDWYVSLSASPDSIGSKTNYGLYFSCEYL